MRRRRKSWMYEWEDFDDYIPKPSALVCCIRFGTDISRKKHIKPLFPLFLMEAF
jgi:hypothetical protein